MSQVWRCPDCGSSYWSPMDVREVGCGGVHSPAGRRVMELIAVGDEADAASPSSEEATSTVRRDGGKGG